jgi:hypothetical protein
MNLFNEPIRSYEFDQEQLILNILELHAPAGIEADFTYSVGGFYRGAIPVPRLKFDINPQSQGVIKADAANLPLQANSIQTSMVDPPFFWGRHGGGKMAKRFGTFKDLASLQRAYKDILEEQHRILKPGGILIFKCQDICNGRRQFMIHNDVLNFALGTGFMIKDLFLLLQKYRHFHPEEKQSHARKHHCYFWVFRKRQRRRRVSKN